MVAIQDVICIWLDTLDYDIWCQMYSEVIIMVIRIWWVYWGIAPFQFLTYRIHKASPKSTIQKLRFLSQV